MKSDVLALTETQLFPHDSDVDIQENLKPFVLYTQDHRTDKYLNLAVCNNYFNDTTITQIKEVMNFYA